MPSNLEWFRVYNRLLLDGKIQSLTDAEFRVLIAVWCLASESRDRGRVTEHTLDAIVRMAGCEADGHDEATGIFVRLEDVNLITVTGHVIEPVNWWELQFPDADERKKQRDIVHARKRRERVAAEQADLQEELRTSRESDADATQNRRETDAPIELEGELEGLNSPNGLSSASPRLADVKGVYQHWREERDKKDKRYDTLRPGRRQKIEARLNEGYTPDDLNRAIDGVALDPWEERNLHDDLTVIFRSAQQVDRFLAFHEQPLPGGGKSLSQVADEARRLRLEAEARGFQDA